MRGAILGTDRALPFGQDRELRLLEYAVVASIALHVLAIAGLQRIAPRPQPSAVTPAPISARLLELEAPAPFKPAAAAPAQEDAQPAPASMTRLDVASPLESTPAARPEVAVAPTPEPKAAPRREAQSAPKPRPNPGAQAAADARPKARVEPAPRPATAAQPAADGAKPSPASSAPTVDVDALARYRLQLIGAARHYKRYPRAAMDNQWEGAAEVALVVDADGRIRDMAISRSSGHAVLDQQAIDMFRKAKPRVPIPAALLGREFRVTLKAIYSLREPGA